MSVFKIPPVSKLCINSMFYLFGLRFYVQSTAAMVMLGWSVHTFFLGKPD